MFTPIDAMTYPMVLTDTSDPDLFVTIQRALFRSNARASYPEVTDLFASVVFFLMWITCRKFAFQYFLRDWARKMGAPDELTEYKWSVLAWNGLFHTWSTLWLLNWLPKHRWYWHTEGLWENILAPNPQKMELEMKAFYMLQLGYHLQSTVWHLMEERRPDFVAMFVHHIVTVVLIVASYLSFYARIGMLVLLVHDASDIFVCITKGTHMCGWKSTSQSCFVVMVLVWMYTRLYLFPFWVIASCWSYPEPARFNFSWFVFVGLLTILLVLHIWWFSLFIKMARGIVKHGGTDITENKGVKEEEERLRKQKERDIEMGKAQI